MRFGIPTIVVGHKTNSVFYTEFDPATNVYKADLYTGAVYKLVAAPPPRASIASINAGEALASRHRARVRRQPTPSSPDRQAQPKCRAAGRQPRPA